MQYTKRNTTLKENRKAKLSGNGRSGEVDAPTAKKFGTLATTANCEETKKLPPPPLDVSVSDSEMPEVENDSSGDGNRQSKTVENADDNIEPENDEEDTIEYIVERRICDDGYIEYKVHWANTTEDQDEWFPRDDLVVEYPRQVEILKQMQTVQHCPNQ